MRRGVLFQAEGIAQGDGQKQGFPGGSEGKESAFTERDPGSVPGWEDPLEKGMATHSSILAWRIPWSEEPCGLQPMELQRAEHD